ncbi:MAG: c-type cytochrome [Acidobacteriota bacterium]
MRPEQVLDFPTLYANNCAGCHGEHGVGGAGIALANPTYLQIAGEQNLRDATGKGVKGSLMPAFARNAGGTLTSEQIEVLVHGMMSQWSGAQVTLTGAPGYRASSAGDTPRGQLAFQTSCASCHGADGRGVKGKTGSIIDPSYLALISDQALRSFVIAGHNGRADWRSYSGTPMSDQQVTDVVAWMASQRAANPGQPYSESK